MIRHKLLVCNSKWNVFLKTCYPPSVQIFGLILKMRLQQSIKFWSFLNERGLTISRFCFVCSLYCFCGIFLQGCSTWWVRHSFCILISLYCQCFPNLKINYEKVFAFMLKFLIFALMMYFMNRFYCCLQASRLTNIFPLMKNFMTFQHGKTWYKSKN